MSDNEIVKKENTVNQILDNYSECSKRKIRNDCTICSSAFRDEIEAYFEACGRKYKATSRWMLENKQIQLSYKSVKNHMIYHYKGGQDLENLSDYADDVKQWYNLRRNKVISLRTKIAVLEKEMFSMAAETGDYELSAEEKRKNIDLIRKLSETILSYETKLAEFEKRLEPVKIVIDSLKDIINDELSRVKNQETRDAIARILKNLGEKIGDMVINED